MKLLSLISLISVCLVFVHCGGGGGDPEPQPTQEEIVSEKLIAGNSWGAGAGTTVTVEGVNVTSDLFSGFTLKFAANTMTTTGTSPVFKPSDTWSFKPNSNATVIVRGSDSKELTIVNLTDTELVLQMEWDQTTTSGGRTKSIPGTHVFTLKK